MRTAVMTVAAAVQCLAAPDIPFFLTFDSKVAPQSIPAAAGVPQLGYVWGAGTDAARLAAYKANAPQAQLSYYMPYSRAPAAAYGFTLAWFQEHHPDWVLYRCDRKTVAFWDNETAPTGSVPIDFTNPEVIAWQAANQSAVAAALGYPLMAIDNYGVGARIMANPGRACGVWLRNGTWAPWLSGTGASVDPLMKEASLRWLELMRVQMDTLAPSVGLVPNFALVNWPWDGADAQRVAAASGAVLSERGFTAWGWGNARVPAAELRNILGWMESLAAQGKGYYSINEVTAEGHTAASIDWALGCFLLGKSANATNQAVWFGLQQAYGGWSYLPEYAAPIGQPLAPHAALPTGADVLFRNYTNGVVVVNAGADAPATVALDPARKYVDPRGAAAAPGGAVVLEPQSAAVLVFH